LQNKKYDDQAAKVVSLLIMTRSSNSALLELDLSYNHIGNEGASALAQVIHMNNTLKSFDIRGNVAITGHVARELANSILDSNILQTFGGIPVKDLKENKTNEGTKKISLRGKRCTDSEVMVLGSLLEKNTTLKELDLRNNKFGSDGAKYLGRGLEYNSSLTLLDVSTNDKIGLTGILHIMEGLKVNSTLTSLILQENKLGDKGAQIVGDLLKMNTTLTFLDLYSNGIKEKGAIAITKALKEKTTKALKKLHVRANKFPEQNKQELKLLVEDFQA